MSKLLEKAQEIPNRKHNKNSSTAAELIELSLAWAKGEISLNQVSHALGGVSPTSCYGRLAAGLRLYINSKNNNHE